MTNVNAVLFDYGLVLSGPPDPDAWERLKAVLQAEEAGFHEAYWKHRRDYDRGALTAEAYWRTAAGDLGRTLDERQLECLVDADAVLWTQPNQPMIDWAAALQRAGVKTGVLSNIGDRMETGVLARCGWLSDFAHVAFSHRLKMAKPDAAIYLHSAEGLGEESAAILFIDDRKENVDAARGAGMQAIQYADHETFLVAMRDGGFGRLLDV